VRLYSIINARLIKLRPRLGKACDFEPKNSWLISFLKVRHRVGKHNSWIVES
jgi:hypothetical protein